MSLDKKTIAQEIAAFLNKHANDRKRVPIADYEFNVISLGNVSISSDSIDQIDEASFHFYGTATIERLDPASKVSDIGQTATFNGTAFYAQDVAGVNNLLVAQIDQIKAQI